jgi:hypothetical protein
MAMEVDRTSAYVPPGPERVMAENEPRSIDRYLCVGLDAVPASARCHSGIIVVAGDEVLLAI